MKKLFTLLFTLSFISTFAQPSDSAVIKSIYNKALSSDYSYETLRYLCKNIGPRLSGSENAEKAVKYMESAMKTLQFDKVYLQEVVVPVWRRLSEEKAEIRSSKKTKLNICALGGSVSTPAKGLQAEVIEVNKIEELSALGEEKVKGKIVFFNRPMDPTFIETFSAYSGAVNQRSRGASEAAKFGAVACIVRSMSFENDPHPHTGAMRYDPKHNRIPAAAVSTLDADVLSKAIKSGKTSVWMNFQCDTLPDAISYNVIGEITGSEFPDQIITVGGHLDSWDLGEGAHDDGAGCVQSVEVLRLFKELGIRPKRTIRAVMFMNEENGLRGGLKYAEEAKRLKENHLAAIESDAGAFTPRGFDIDASPEKTKKIISWKPLLEPYGLAQIKAGGSGADIGPLKNGDVTLIGFRPDSQRYFDIHHAASDTFEKISKRELQMGSASMASLIFLIDKYGL